MGASKKEWESVYYTYPGCDIQFSRLREKNPVPKWVPKKNVPSDVRVDSEKKLSDAYEEYFNNPDRYDEIRDSLLTGSDREY